ncbi:MAG: alpha/beta fold hydrolase [Myxococcales bacterium]|nr:alpha/beta fold hydrolase [Myxococcales bacterium]
MRAGLIERGLRRAMNVVGYRSRHLDTSIGPMHVIDREGGGALPPVVVVHGLGSSAVHFVPLLRRLAPHAQRVVAIDLPGHGFSTRLDALDQDVLRAGVLEALDQLELPPAIVVGNSLGGAATVRYTSQRPDRVLGTVLLAPAGAPMTPEELQALRDTFAIRTHAEAVAFLHRLLARPPGWTKHVVAVGVRRTFSDPVLQSWLSELKGHDFLTPEEVRGVPPTLLVWGDHERILPGSALAFWQAHLPEHARIVRDDAVGHSPHLDAVDRAASYVLDHARALAQSSP